MKSARLHSYGHPLSLDEVPMPTPAPGEVIVRIAGAGFCHSDLHVIDGEIRVLPRLPLILGHENAGFVAALGAGVTSVREGDPVVPLLPCYVSYYRARHGVHHLRMSRARNKEQAVVSIHRQVVPSAAPPEVKRRDNPVRAVGRLTKNGNGGKKRERGE